MKITVSHITKEGLHIKFNSAVPWIVKILREVFLNESPHCDSIDGQITLLRFGDHVRLDGELKIELDVFCDRCLKNFIYPFTATLFMNLTPAPKSEGRQVKSSHDEIELNADDLEYAAYENDEFNLEEIIREQCVLSIPPKYICSDNCKGLCPRCRINLNIQSCSCGDSVTDDSPWGILKNYSKPKSYS